MSAGDHVPHPTQETYKHLFHIRCSCGWKTPLRPQRVAWAMFRQHWHLAMYGEALAKEHKPRKPAPDPNAMTMFDPKEYESVEKPAPAKGKVRP